MNDLVVVEKQSGVSIVRLNRPERMNALSRATLSALGEAGRTLRDDPDTRVVILTGTGTRAFCAGADLKERTTMTTEQVRDQLLAYRTELDWLERGPVPTVCAINGVALGGGLELALMCDLRVAVSSATFALPETTLAIVPGAGGTQRLPRLVGEPRAREMILLGRSIDASRALDWGLVNTLAPEDRDLVEFTLEFVAPLRHGAPVALMAARDAIWAARHTELEMGLKAELACYERCLQSEDRLEALAARRDKREPEFRGR